MRKDYIEATGSTDDEGEAGFVERYWTRVWQEGKGDDAWNREIARRIEYRWMMECLGTANGLRVLDGGCGTGQWTLALKSAGLNVTGLDISKATIAELKQHFPDMDFQIGDLRALAFPDNSFDGLFSWGAFEHFEEGLGPCLREARRVLRPGGWIFLTVPHHNPRLMRKDRRSDVAVLRGGATAEPARIRFYQWRFTPGELARELHAHGFDTRRIEPIDRDVGVHRMLVTDWGLRAGSIPYAVARRLVTPFLGAAYCGHMLFVAACKRGST